MKQLFAGMVLVHSLIHLMGPAKAFGFAGLPQLAQPISKTMGLLWLLAAVLLVATAIALFVKPAWWRSIGALALAVSQCAIATAWSDAKYGTIVNIILVVAIVIE
jgi:hypothetical protein